MAESKKDCWRILVEEDCIAERVFENLPKYSEVVTTAVTALKYVTRRDIVESIFAGGCMSCEEFKKKEKELMGL